MSCVTTTLAGPDKRHVDLTFPQGVSVTQNTIYIPFRQVGRLISIEARIDTLQGIFIFDTGSSDLLLNENYFEPENIMATTSSYGVTGGAGALKVRDVDTLFWDALEIRGIEGHIVSLSHIEQQKHIRLIGILGYSVFKDFEVLIDYSIRQLIVTRVDKKGNRIEPGAIFQTPHRQPTIQIDRAYHCA